MENQNNHPVRKKHRLQGYDYSTEALYYVTICTELKIHRFGKIDNNQMHLNNKGLMIENWLNKLESKFQGCQLFDYVIMPNHIHFIIEINHPMDKKYSLNKIIQWFKIMTTNEYIREVKSGNWERFENRIWQRSFHEHIIRNNKSCNAISDYIANNVYNWQVDHEM